MLRYGLVFLALAGAIAAAPLEENEHSIQRRQIINPLDDIARLFDGSPIGIAAVVAIIIVGLAIDVIIVGSLAAAFTGRAKEDYSVPIFGEFFDSLYNSVDIVEMALKYMSVEEEACKYKAVCKAEQLAVRNPIAKLAINTINSNLSGLAKYANAVEAGLNGEDCDLLYDQCRDRLAF